MNITYNTIIEYLVNNKENNNFSIKKNLLKYSSEFPDNFKQYFGEKFFRYGIQVYDNEQNNISLYSSIFHLLNKKFLLLDKIDQIKYIYEMKDNIKNYLRKNYKNFPLKSKFNKIFSIDVLNSNKFNPLLLEIFCYTFNINIIVFDYENNDVTVAFDGNYLNKWKPTLFLAKMKNFWEPIYNENNKIFRYNNTIKNILEDIDSYFSSSYLEKDLIIIDNINEILEMENDECNEDEDEDNNKDTENYKKTDNKLFVNQGILKLNIKKSKLNKMKKEKIIELIEEYNLNISVKGLNKKNIIEKIIKNI